jgi:uncharacterized protein (DUF1499 family)
MTLNMTATHAKTAHRIKSVAIALLLLMPIAALGTRFGVWPFTTGLLLLLLSFGGSMLIQVINAIWLWRKPDPETKSALRWASLYALPALLLFAAILRGSPGNDAMIHNISTDLVNPPRFSDPLALRGADSNPVAFTAEIAAIQAKAFPELAPIITELQPAKAFQRALTTAREMDWQIHSEQPEVGHIEATDSSFWFGFKDDIAIRVTPHTGGSQLDLHSVSRVGKGDLGANAKRIMRFSERYQQAD